MTRRTILLVASAFLALGAAATWWWFFTGSPEYSLRQLATAAAAHERLRVEEYVDVHGVAVAAVDELVQKQMATALQQGSDDRGLGALGTALGMTMVQNLKPVLTARLEQAFLAAAGDDAAQRASKDSVRASDLRKLGAEYAGIVASERVGSRARVSLSFRRPPPDTGAIVLALRLEKVDHHWRVTAVEGLAEQLLASGGLGALEGGNPLQRAYIASMKSDLRNLVTSEEAYFADSLKYGRHVACAPTPGKVIFCATTGNILSGPVLSGQGWSAKMGNDHLPGVTCAIFVMTAAVPPATVEGIPACK